jgi:hypothetical protein
LEKIMFGKLKNERHGAHTKPEWDAVVIAQGYLCFYCGRPICENSPDPDLEITKDHLFAQSRGGVDFIWNIVAACLACNRMKGAKLPGQFLRERWAFAHAVDTAAEKSTRIPLDKGRAKGRSYQSPEENAEGVYVTAHLEVSDQCAQMIRYLDHNRKMPDTDTDGYWQQRRRQLEEQIHSLGRRFLESAGQMQLQLEMPSSPPKPPQTDVAALTLRGMHVTENRA